MSPLTPEEQALEERQSAYEAERDGLFRRAARLHQRIMGAAALCDPAEASPGMLAVAAQGVRFYAEKLTETVAKIHAMDDRADFDYPIDEEEAA